MNEERDLAGSARRRSNPTSRRVPFVGANWKMNTTLASAVELAEAVVAISATTAQRVDIVLFPPFPYVQAVGRSIGHRPIAVGAQNFWPARSGAFTGEVGFEILDDLAVGTVLVGHSERRQHNGEDDGLVERKVTAATGAGLRVVLCVGETLDQREAGDAERVVCRQVEMAMGGVGDPRPDLLVVAYEPVWAIGTGKTAEPKDAQAGHASIRRTLATRYHAEFAESVRIIYGGSVTATSAAAIFDQPDVDGGLIGGASLNPEAFAAICQAAAHAAHAT